VAAVVLTFLVGLIGFGVLIGLLVGGPRGERFEGPRGHHYRAPAVALVAVGVLGIGGAATALAYRRLSGPVGELLGAAEQVAAGRYDVQVVPEGPHELQVLTRTFNDMAARLAATEAQRRRFLADITHELRTPLAVLQSGIEAQLDGIHPHDDQHLASLLEETQRLGRLIGDLHTLALADAGRIVLHRERTLPAPLVEDAVGGHAALAERKGVRLVATVAPALTGAGADTDAGGEIDVDPVRIHQVLDNLLANALRHTPAGGEVRVTADVAPEGAGGGRGGGGVRIAVTDTGPGFPPGLPLDQVFDRFARSVDSQGSGLGLSIARDLVQAHGGTITAWNQASGGAGVAFTLPPPPVP
jgi:signal transduction histidine kinase